jgi:hypothetical protein
MRQVVVQTREVYGAIDRPAEAAYILRHFVSPDLEAA